MKTPEERGRAGRWLVNARMARGFSTKEKALEALAAAGTAISSSVYAEYEAGTKQPSKRHMPLLVSFWGEMPPELPIADSASLIVALNRQAAAMEQLIAKLDSLATTAIRQGVADALAEAAASRASAVSRGVKPAGRTS